MFFLPDNRSLVARDGAGDRYVAIKMEVSEQLSEPFRVSAALLVHAQLDRHRASNPQLLNQPLCICYRPGFDTHRSTQFVVHGHVTEIREFAKGRGELLWEVELRPWLSLLGLRINCRIFHNSDVRQIIEQVCQDYDFDTSIKFIDCGDLPPRVFCVQYQESDLSFVCRLLSEEGLHFYFSHSEDRHVMMVGASNQTFAPLDGGPVEFGEQGGNKGGNKSRGLRSWNSRYESHYGGDAVAMGFSREQALVVSSSCVRADGVMGVAPSGGRAVWDARIEDQSMADRVALLAVNRGTSQRVDATGSLTMLRCGIRFELSCHAEAGQPGGYFIEQMAHQFHCAVAESADNRQGTEGRQQEYHNSFSCVAIDCVYVPPVLEKPRIYGLQTATVSGSDGQEIYHNGQGSIKVRFHWDVSDTPGDRCSCWVPVAQSLAGAGYGASVLPRVGQEVVVCFIDGDPDRPVVTGSLYNGLHKWPYDSDQMGVKTLTMPDGTAGHEITIDDAKDREQFVVKSQKDLSVDVMNDMVSNVAGNQTMTVEKEVVLASGADVTIEAKSAANYSSGTQTVIKGQSVTIEASAGITMKAGNSKIAIEPAGITIKAPAVTVESDALTKIVGKALNVQGELLSIKGQMANVSGKMITVDGDACVQLNSKGVLIINGKLTMVN